MPENEPRNRSLEQILEQHRAWVEGEPGGVQATFHSSRLDYADLREANLRGALFQSTTILNAQLQRADLSGAVFIECDCRGSDLSEVDLTGSEFRSSSLAA